MQVPWTVSCVSTVTETLPAPHADDAVYAAVWTMATNWRAVTIQYWLRNYGLADPAALAELDSRIDRGVTAAMAEGSDVSSVVAALALAWRSLELPVWKADPKGCAQIDDLLDATCTSADLAQRRASLALAVAGGPWPWE